MTTKVYIAGSDPEVEEIFSNAKKIIEEAGHSFEDEALRLTIAEALGKAQADTAEAGTKKATVSDGGDLVIAGAPTTKRRAKPGQKYWYDKEGDRQFLDWYILGRRNGTVEGALIVVGPSGTGKTEGIIQACERLDVPLYIVNCASITTIEKWVGHKEIDHTGTHFVLSEPMRWIEAKDPDCPPGVVLLDEGTRLHPTFHNITFPLLDGQQRIFIPEMHGYLEVHPQTAFIMTANIGGKYTGTFTMDEAMRERFGYTVEREWPPAAEEAKILSSLYPTIEEEKIKLMVQIANRSRQMWVKQDLSRPISTRILIFACRLVRDGASIARAFELTAVPLYSQDGGQQSERGLIKGIISGKGGEGA